MTAYTRKGECNNCGWCCQFEGVYFNTAETADGAPLSASDQKFYELRGGRVLNEGRIIRYLIHAYAPCSAHDQEKQTCSVYDERPDICRAFPSSPEQVEGTPCSFWFEGTTDTGDVVRRGGVESPYPTQPH